MFAAPGSPQYKIEGEFPSNTEKAPLYQRLRSTRDISADSDTDYNQLEASGVDDHAMKEHAV